MNYFNFNDTFIDEDTNQEYSGICFDVTDFSEYEDYYNKYVVDHPEVYRPDIIAYNLWGDINLAWVLNEINHIGIKDYTYEKELNYVSEEILISLGIK